MAQKFDSRPLTEDAAVPPLDGEDPIALFEAWLAEATKKEVNDPTAVALATADADGVPNVRMVLLKAVDKAGFVFYTNLESIKGGELAANPNAALCFHWKSLRRQVRVQGPASLVPDAEADAYFASRPRDSQIGAWASRQSRPLEGRFELEGAIARTAARFGIGRIERPAHWSGYRLTPRRVEFWRERAFRLHDRLVFAREAGEGTRWSRRKLYP